jgi:undecaprenyl diphosphate synthase
MTSDGAEAVVPHHVAIVMDGNGRWAKHRFLPRIAGHRQGLETLRQVIRWSMTSGVQVLTVFAFSSENWKRPADEVNGLMALMAKALSREVPELHKAGVRLCFPGDRSVLEPDVLLGLEQAEQLTCANTRLVLNVCFNYGGRWDIAHAAQQVQAQGLPMTEANLAQYLALSHVPDPDLVIRTGGEQRISNFLLWQMAYSELVFTDKLWPAFSESDFQHALAVYARRERRFGQTSEQIHPLSIPPLGEG